MVAKVHTVALTGFEGALVEVETDSKQGLPAIVIVGMGSRAIDEARERVRSAIRNSLLTFPPQKITVNLAPAELPKEGAHFDLPIALSVLIASGQLKQTEVNHAVFAGELALDGTLRPIRGALSIAKAAKEKGFEDFMIHDDRFVSLSLSTKHWVNKHKFEMHVMGIIPSQPLAPEPFLSTYFPEVYQIFK